MHHGSNSQFKQAVHTWRVPLECPAGIVERLVESLSPDERQRADRLVRPELRRRFVVCRGVLRQLLGQAVRCSPARLEFRYTDLGKPVLRVEGEDSAIAFSVSHSDDLALIALTAGGQLGVDLERIRPVAAMARIVAQHFSLREQRSWNELPTTLQPAAFFLAWTAKEALLKACGLGIRRGLTEVEVEINPDLPQRVWSFSSAGFDSAATAHKMTANSWDLRRLFPADGYVGAIALNGSLLDLQMNDWSHFGWFSQSSPGEVNCATP